MSKHKIRYGGEMGDDSGPREKLAPGGTGYNAGTGLSRFGKKLPQTEKTPAPIKENGAEEAKPEQKKAED